jgi:hypothetical protein
MEIPRPLRLIHGDHASLFDILLVYIAGAVFAVLAFLYASDRLPALTAGRAILLFVIAFETGAGVVATLSSGTSAYYSRHPALRWVIIGAQVVQPALLALLFDGRLAYWAFLYVYTVAAATLTGILGDGGRRQVAGAALVVVGIVALLPVGASHPGLAWFAPVYMLKVILGLAARGGARD